MPDAVIDKKVFFSQADTEPLAESLADIDAQIRQLGLICQMPADFLGLDYRNEPSFLASLAAFGSRHDLVLIRPPGFTALAGLGIRSVRSSYLGGRPASIGYLHHLRFHPKIRGGSYLLRGYKAFREIFRDQPLPVTLTSILADNQYARQLLETGRAGGTMPVYKPISRFLTAMIPLSGPGSRWPENRRPRRADNRFKIRLLDAGDLPDLHNLFARAGSHYDGAPCLDFRAFPGLRTRDMLGIFDGPALVGASGVWNQQHFRQIIVTHLGSSLAFLQKCWRYAPGIFGACPIPDCGDQVNFVLLDPWAIEPGREIEIMPHLLRAASREARRRGAMFAAIGMAEAYPAIASLKAVFFIPYWSIIYQVFWPENGSYDFSGRPLHLANLGAL